MRSEFAGLIVIWFILFLLNGGLDIFYYSVSKLFSKVVQKIKR